MLGWTSPMQPLLTSPHPPVGSEPLSAEFISWVGSINYLGSILGTFFWGILSDRLGRKNTLSLVALPFLVSWCLTLAAQSGWWLLVARFGMGIGCSGVTVNTPIYIAELADPKIRGSLGSLLVMFVNAGCLFANVVGAFLPYHGVALVCLSIPLIFLLISWFLPQTPMYILTHGKRPEEDKCLLWLRGGDSLQLAKEVEALEKQPKSFDPPSFRDLFSSKGARKALFIGVGLVIGQQFCGFLPIITFSVKIFQDTGTSMSAYHCMIIIGCLQLISATVSSALVDRSGRRILLMLSFLAISSSLAMLGLYLHFKTESWGTVLRLIPVFCLSTFVIFFAVGVGPVPFVVMSEIFPSKFRGFAMAKLQMFSNTLGFLTVKTFPFLNLTLGFRGCFLFYASCCALIFVFTLAYVPETKGKPLQVILRELNGEIIADANDSEGTELYAMRKAEIVKVQVT